MSMRKTIQWLSVAFLFVARLAFAQQTPQVNDNNYALGNAPYSNAAPSAQRTFLPGNEVGFIQNAQPFAPAEISDYCLGQPAHDGFFFNYERLFWSISRPASTKIGSAAAEGPYIENGTLVTETNSLDTSCLDARFGWGNRWELGYVDVNNYGWYVGVLDHVAQNQQIVAHGAQVLFNDPNNYLFGLEGTAGYVNAAIVLQPGLDSNGDGILDTDITPHRIFPRFENLRVSNNTLLNGVEILRSYRVDRLHKGGVLDLYFGARFFQVDDRFTVQSYNTNRINTPVYTATFLDTALTGTPTLTLPIFSSQFSVLDDITISTRAQNNIVGPEFAARYATQRGRWKHEVEGRFMAGVNTVNLKQTSSVATHYFDQPTAIGGTNNAAIFITQDVFGRPVLVTEQGTLVGSFQGANNLYPASSASTKSHVTFAPVGELRYNVSYELTRNIALKAGYTCLVANGITRASNRVDYTLLRMGILDGGTHQNLVVNGLSFGIEYNR